MTSLNSNVLSIERYADLLKPHGKYLTIIDESVLNTQTARKFRDFIKKHFIIRAVISLPINTFVNADAEVKTSILYLIKKEKEDEDQPNIFMAISENVGHTDLTKLDLYHEKDDDGKIINKDIKKTILDAYFDFIENLKNHLQLKIKPENKNIFIVKKEEIEDRIDCYSLSYELKKLVSDLNKLKDTHDLIRGKDLEIVKRINQEEFKGIATQEFKYIEVKHTSKQPNLINGFKKGVLMMLSSRARQKIEENDIILPKPISSIEKIAIIPKELNGQLCSTGFIVIRPKDYDEACLLTAILKSSIAQRQLFLMQSGCTQPEISQNAFKKIIIPLPKLKEEKDRIISNFKNEHNRTNILQNNSK